MDWPGTPNAASQWPGTPVAPKQAWPGTPLAAMHDRAPLQADALHDRPPIASQPEVSGKLSFAPIGNESFAHKAVQGAASLADVARRASKAAGGVVSDFASAPFEAVQEQIKAMRQGEGLASNPASVPNAPEQAGQVAGAASMGVAETPRLAGDIPKPIPPKIEPQAPGVRPTVADIPKATGEWPGTPNPVARQAGQAAVAKVAERVEQKPGDLYAKAMQDAHQTPAGKQALKAQKNIAADQGHDKVAMQGFTKQANSDLSKLTPKVAKPVPTPATKPPTTPGYKPSSITEALIKKGNNFFADEFAKQNEKTSLPMDDAARAKRAKALGFRTDLTLYHGTGKSFLEFDISKAHHGEAGVFATDKPHVAQMYGGSKILPLWGKFQNPMEVDWPKVAGYGSYSSGPMKKLIAEAKANGNDTLIIKNINDLGGPQTQYVFLKPENLRAKDVAVFDPKKVNSPNLLSAAAPGAPGSSPPVAKFPDPTIKSTVKKLSDDLHRLDRKHDEVKIGALKAARELPPEAVALKQKFFEHLDPGKKPALSTEEKSIFRRTLAPWLERQQDLYAEIRRLAPSLLPKDFDPDYVHHLVKGRVPEFDQPLGEMSREGTYPYQGGKKLPRSTRSLQSSRYYAIEDAKGNRRVVMLNKDGNLYLMQGKKPVNVPAKDITGEVAPGNTVSIGGKDWTLKRASVAEKESATNLKYYKDAYAATLSNVVRLEKVADALHFFETMKKDPEFLEGARRPGDNRPTPAEWRTTTLPGWEGWRFEPRLAEVMDDWHDKPGEAWSENLKQLNHAVLGSLFLLPFRHMGNVGAHYYVGRGWDWLSAPAWVNMAKDTTAAIMDVAKQGPMTRAMLKEGSALQYPRVANQDFYGQMLKSLGEDMKAGKYDSIFQRVGIKPKEFYDGWLKASSAAMWSFNDVLMQSRVRELMHKGMSMGDAIRVAEKDIPNYRINSRVMMDNKAGRAMSRYLQNSLFSAFGRYNNNKWRAIADMAADIAKGNPKERMDAVGKFVALASLVYFLMWPLDAAIKKLTGDKNKRSSPIGPASVVDELKQGAELLGSTRSLKRLGATDDQVDASQLFQSMIELSPLAEQVMTQTTGHNPYTGQDVKTLGERAQSVAGEIDPLAIGSDIASGRETPTEEILKSTIGERSVRHPPPPRVQTQQERAREKAESRQPINRLVSGGERKLRPFTPDAIVNWLLHQGPGP